MNFLIFLGTVRDSTPPKPARLGVRVATATLRCLATHYPEHEFETIDALDYPLESIFKPHFAYAKSNVPEQLDTLATKIQSTDGYVMISPEYNHSMSPALANLLNHFGSSLFSYKPSAIVTYSAGQWGGMRAAAVFNADGTVQASEDPDRWFNYFNRTFAQMLWWAEATKAHREKIDPHGIGDFRKAPSERNAP